MDFRNIPYLIGSTRVVHHNSKNFPYLNFPPKILSLFHHNHSYHIYHSYLQFLGCFCSFFSCTSCKKCQRAMVMVKQREKSRIFFLNFEQRTVTTTKLKFNDPLCNDNLRLHTSCRDI